MSCSASGDGKFYPARMNDGRLFTDYRPRCITNTEMMKDLYKKNITASSYDSRMYLQKNAEKIMEEQQNNAMENVRCTRPPTEVDTMLPEKYIVKCTNVSCVTEEVNPYGLGHGRKY